MVAKFLYFLSQEFFAAPNCNRQGGGGGRGWGCIVKDAIPFRDRHSSVSAGQRPEAEASKVKP